MWKISSPSSVRPRITAEPPVSTMPEDSSSSCPDSRSTCCTSENSSSARGSITSASVWRDMTRGARSPIPGPSIISFGSASWRSATPWRVLIASASAVGVRSAMAMSLVIWSPAIGITAVCRIAPWVKIARSVVPPPMSTRHTPRSFSSSESTARDEASGCRIRSFTSRPQRRTHLTMFCAADTAPVTMCTFTSRRTPDMPTGSRTSSWPSMMNSWRSTCRICWSVGMLTARAVSMARSTSTTLTSRSLTATMPVELKLRMWLPAMPVKAEAILQSAISSASSSARWMADTVASIFTTTPFFSPRESWLPMPSTSRVPSGASSATSAATLEVPISRPTTRLRFSFGIASAFPARDPQGKAVRVAQVDVREARRVAPREAPQRLREHGDEAREPRLHGLAAVAAELERQPAGEPQLPGVTGREDHALGRLAERREDFHEAPVALRDQRLAACRAGEHEQRLVVAVGEALAEGVDQSIRIEVARDLAPAREGDVLLDARLDAIGPDAAHVHAPHPGNLLEASTHRAQIDGEEVAAESLRRALQVGALRVLQLAQHHDLAHRKERRAQQQLEPRGAEQQHSRADEQVRRDVQLAGVIPHAPTPVSSRTGLRS